MMELVALCSGGKDSTYALWLAQKAGHLVKKIIAIFPSSEDSLMYHSQNVHIVRLFGECIGIPVVGIHSEEGEIEEIKALRMALEDKLIDGVVSGVIASLYQKKRIDEVCEGLGLEHLAPLWGGDPVELLKEMLLAGFRTIVTRVAAEGFEKEWLGRELDARAIEELVKLSRRHGINLAGEGGEYESLVIDAPFFIRRIKILEAEKVWRGTHGSYIIKKAELEEKV